MMYPFLQLPDGTEIVHSEMKEDGRVKVYVEKPDEKDFFTMPSVGSRSIVGRRFTAFPRRKWTIIKSIFGPLPTLFWSCLNAEGLQITDTSDTIKQETERRSAHGLSVLRHFQGRNPVQKGL